MSLKKPSDLFKRDDAFDNSSEGQSDGLQPNSDAYNQYSETFDNYKRNLNQIQVASVASGNFSGTLEEYNENIQRVNILSEQVDNIQSQVKTLLSKEDLDRAMMAQLMLVDQNFAEIQTKIDKLNSYQVNKIRSEIKELGESVYKIVENDIPKYRKMLRESEVSFDERVGKLEYVVDESIERVNDSVADRLDGFSEEIGKIQENTDQVREDAEKLASNVKDSLFDTSEKLTERFNDLQINSHRAKVELDNFLQLDLERERDRQEQIKDFDASLREYRTEKDELDKKVLSLEEEISRNEELIGKYNEDFKVNLLIVNEDLKTAVGKINEDISSKNDTLAEEIQTLKESLAEFEKKQTLLNEEIGVDLTDVSKDPLTPLDKQFVTLQDLQKHYRLFLNRVQLQLESLGGGGIEDAPKDGSVYVRTRQSWKTLSQVGVQTFQEINVNERVAIGTCGDQYSEDFVVCGDQRVTGTLSIGTSSIILDPEQGIIFGVETIELGAIGSANTVLISRTDDGIINFTDTDGTEASVGIGTSVNVHTSGIITATHVHGGSAAFDGNVTIGGTLTYDDVRNVDSIGIITARKDVIVGGGISAVGVVTASAFIGDGSQLTGIDATSLKDDNGVIKVQANTDGAVVTGILTANHAIGTPGGGFKSGAFTISSSDFTKDSINELNFILGKLVPTAPDTLNGLSVSLTGTQGTAYLCQGFTPTNNTGGSAPSAGSAYTRNTDSTITSNYINDVGPGDNGTVVGNINGSSVGSIAFDTNTNNGTDGGVQVADNKDASQSTRNAGITAAFYQVYDVRFINASSPDGYNKASFTHGSATSGEVFWYEDPSTVSAPIISFGSVNTPNTGSHIVAYSSGVPHYTESTNNNFTYTLSVENASGDMYSRSDYKLLNSDGATTGFANPGHKYYTNFTGGTHPPARNFGVGTPATTTITNTPRNIHNTITSNHFTRYDATTPYGSHNNQRVSFSTSVNIMGTTATTSQIDEDNILISSLGTGSGNATRVDAGSSGDNPTPVHTIWNASSSVPTHEAVVRGGTLRHDQTNYAAYLPIGPDYSTGRSGTQYFQIELIRSNVSEFNISYTGSAAGCFVCMPDNSAWTTSLSGTNGWADMFQAYRGSGIPTSAEPGCSSGGVMDNNGGTFTCVFGTESSSNDSNNRILIRWKLTSGQSITAMSFSAT